MKKKVLVWVLAAVLLLSMVGCSAANVSSTNDQYVGMEPAAAAEAAAAETKDTAAICSTGCTCSRTTTAWR